jgi:hypothetical protein
MPLSDILSPRICELGKIKIGGLGEERKARNGNTWRMPRKDDHFTITTLYRGPGGDLLPDTKLMESLGEYADSDGKLRQLPVMLLSNDPEEVMQSAWVFYKGKRVAARSDGKTLTKFFDGNEWLSEPVQKPWDPAMGQAKDSKGNPFFKLHTTLNVVIAAKQARWGGFYKFRTTSEISANQLYGSILHLSQLTGGILRGLPLRLVVRPIQVHPNGQVSTVYVVHLELLGPDLTAIQQQALDRAKFELANAQQLNRARIEYRKLLTSPGENESANDQADVADEYHPSEPDAPPEAPDPLAQRLGLQPPAPAAQAAPPPGDRPADDSEIPPGEDGDPEHDPFATAGYVPEED